MRTLLLLLASATLFSCVDGPADRDQTSDTEVVNGKTVLEDDADPKVLPPKITPISHASGVLTYPNGTVLYMDPVGGADLYKGQVNPDVIVITHHHGDHFDPATLAALVARNEAVSIYAPESVQSRMDDSLKKVTQLIANNQSMTSKGIDINAVPMYNITEGRLQNHPKGMGNGYVIEHAGHRTYISGDTESHPEMKALEDIDLAFVCMNLPYTMTPEQAATGIAAMGPKLVIPYHYRGLDENNERKYYSREDFATALKGLNADVEVQMVDWYPAN